MKRLSEIVQKLERGDLPLGEALQPGEALEVESLGGEVLADRAGWPVAALYAWDGGQLSTRSRG